MTPTRPRDPVARAKVVMDMLTGEVPNDKDEMLGRVPDQENGLAKARRAAAARWSGA